MIQVWRFTKQWCWCWLRGWCKIFQQSLTSSATSSFQCPELHQWYEGHSQVKDVRWGFGSCQDQVSLSWEFFHASCQGYQEFFDQLFLVMTAASTGKTRSKRMEVAGLIERLRFIQSIRLGWSSLRPLIGQLTSIIVSLI